jgi:hypothetical protein
MNRTIQRRTGSVPTTARTTGENQAANDRADKGRRRFLTVSLLGFAVAPTATVFLSEGAWAKGREEGPVLLDTKDPQAQALEYTTQSYKGHQSCSNCQLYSGAGGKESGPCALFSYRSDTRSGKPLWVAANGWCRGWAPRQS